MDLNNNPRTDAEKRYRLLIKRRDRVFNYWQQYIRIEFDGDGEARQLVINPSIKPMKATRMMREIDREINGILKYLKQWK